MSSLVPEIFLILYYYYYANKTTHDFTSGSSMVPKYKISNISVNNKVMLLKFGTSLKYITWYIVCCCYGNTLGSSSLSCRMAIPVFHLFQASFSFKPFIGRSSAISTLCLFGIGQCISPYRVTNGTS